MTRRKTLEIRDYVDRDGIATDISNMFYDWKRARRKWEEDAEERRNYIFAVDTTTTTNSKLDWKNKTTVPKLCQIRDNLHANYMAALFAGNRDDWLTWESEHTSLDRDKRKAIVSYILNKFKHGGGKETVSRLLYDWIDNGNVIGDVEYVKEYHTDSSGNKIPQFIGPKIVRYTILDTVFNIFASDFHSTPKITRVVMTLGDLAKEIKTKPEDYYLDGIFDKIVDTRNYLRGSKDNDVSQALGFNVDGFGSVNDYFDSNYVELLVFEGDLFDTNSNTLYENHKIIVVDRLYTMHIAPIDNWYGRSTKEHIGWRLRPDNLMAMGPLDNLVGMQYRIDHLENLKADVFDIIAFPPLKVRGDVADFEWRPLEKIYVGDEGDVTMLVPDTTALNADFQINILEQKMEELAGAPKQAMGIRTPGEKTAFEVQQLYNAASRIFEDKIRYFEENFLEPLLNSMLESAVRNLDGIDTIRVLDEDGIEHFISITREDLTAKGKLRAVGSRHFATKANVVQSLMQLANSAIGQDPGVKVHLSGFMLAQLMEEMLGISKYGLVRKNVALEEQAESQQLAQELQNSIAESALTPGI